MPSFLATSSAHPMFTSATTHVTLSPSKPLISFMSHTKLVAVCIGFETIRYGHKSDGFGAFVGMALGMGLHGSIKHTLMGEVSIDEGDKEAVFDHAVRELHHRYDVSLCRVGDHKCMWDTHGFGFPLNQPVRTHTPLCVWRW
ncbi:hypothetical protein AMTRI_Chr10g224870 [Amborella trichopoda]